MDSRPPTEPSDPRSVLYRAPRFSRRSLIAAVVVVALVVAGVTLGVTDPFKSTPNASGSLKDNTYPTSVTTVKERSLTSQQTVTGTLGYSGSYTVSLPTGTMSSAVTQAEQTVATDESKLASDEAALKVAKRLQSKSGPATIRDARATVASDEKTTKEAQTQLSEDESLGCPASSSLTVTSPLSGSSPSSGGSNSNGSGSDGSGTGPTGGGTHGPMDAQPTGSTPPTVTAAPVVSTGTASSVTSTSETLAGTVNPGGLATTYYFEWGRTRSFGSTTPVESAGDGSSGVAVTATISGLLPNRTYDFTLVASNSLGTTTGETQLFQSAQSSCAAQRTVVSEDKNAVKDAKDTLAVDLIDNGSTVTTDEATITSDKATLAADEQALSSAESQTTNPGSHFTTLPSVGQTITRGQSVYSLDGRPVPLFYGTTIPYRALYLGVSNGPDVAELQENLIALGFGSGISASGQFGASTKADVEAWQRSLGLPATGVVALGDFAVEPGPLLVTTVTATPGSAAQAGSPVLSASGTEHVVSIALDANLAPDVKAGDNVQVTLPDNSVIAGKVSSVGTVATTPSNGNTGATPTVSVTVLLSNTKLAGNLDQASVNVSITVASVSNALVVPVDALLALSGGGYAVEEVSSTGVHSLVPVSLGLFDDAAGLVQVSGSGLAVGQHIVIPAL
ncbi:MAG: peptidoglycan-binding protein [Acidimicrobiales bacterium]